MSVAAALPPNIRDMSLFVSVVARGPPSARMHQLGIAATHAAPPTRHPRCRRHHHRHHGNGEMGAPHAQGRRAQRGITCTRSDGQKRAGRRRSGGDGRDSRGANRRQHGHAFAFISSAPAPARRRDGSPNRSRRASEATKSQSSSLALPCACSHSQFTLTALPLPFARISSHAAAAERERDGANERREGGRRPSISARVMNSERDRQTEVAAATARRRLRKWA